MTELQIYGDREYFPCGCAYLVDRKTGEAIESFPCRKHRLLFGGEWMHFYVLKKTVCQQAGHMPVNMFDAAGNKIGEICLRCGSTLGR